MTAQNSGSAGAVIVKRVDEGPADTTEITELARSAGYRVVGEVTQTRTEDPAYHIGEGKVETVADIVASESAGVVVFDNELGPYQTFNVGNGLPAGVEVIDRFRLILEIFGQRAQTREAQLQVELAELRYELPRAEAKASLAQRDERPGFMGLGEYDESREEDIKARISRLRDELGRMEETARTRRESRRQAGFDLVALAGYTNAGKSTLLRRLAADLDIDENRGQHPDLDETASSHDQLFTTLGTTTRRADMDRRDVLVTDTVGFISDLPHWLVESFKSTLEAVYRADLVLLVVDVSEPLETIREKLVASHDTLSERNEAPIVTVLNKVDAVDEADLDRKREALAALAPNPVAISAATGTNLEVLRDRMHHALPALETERLVLPMTDETMSVVSWIHDHATVQEVEYGDEVIIEFEGRPAVIAQSRAKASELAAAGASA